jgi:hypothetical protein
LRPPNRIKLLIIWFLIAGVPCGPRSLFPAERHSEKAQLFWKETLTPAAKGTRIAVPGSILKDVKANPDDCLNPSPEETTNLEAYQLSKRDFVLIAVWGRSSCFCSPTGNCSFWLYRPRGGKKELLLQTDMVSEFGFLRSTTKGVPDLVLWSHDSAQRFPGALWKFNGAEYVSECSWEVVSTFTDAPDAVAQRLESHIENNTCKLRLAPESETATVNSSSIPK